MNRLRRRIVATLATSVALAPLAPFTRLLAAGLGYSRLMEGPMVGAVTPDSITLWARASGPLPLQVEYSTDPLLSKSLKSEPTMARAEEDFTARLTLRGLRPGTRYYYRVLVDGGADRYHREPYYTYTAPAGPAAFRIAFGSCARRQLDPRQEIFRAISAAEPDVFFWLGDNIYGDSGFASVLTEEYRKQRAIESSQPLLRRVPQLAIWDDHDFGLNNSDRTNPVREGALAAFRNYWANPSFGLPQTPGVFFRYAYGGVDFFFLDGRFYRDPNSGADSARKTLLGAGQKDWLKRELAASTSPFKVLICGSGWSSEDGPDGDTWAAFLTERNELFDYIRERRISGVFCLSGDTHFGEVNCIPWSQRGSYDIYDLVSSPLAQQTGTSFLDEEPEMRIRPPYFRSCNFGVLDFSIDPEPTVRFTLRDDRGDVIYAPLTLKASELVNGRSTWRDQIDPALLKKRGV